MGGPIVRTGTTPEYWANWDSIFGGKKKKGKSAPAKASSKAAKKSPKKSTKKKAGKK